MDHGKVRQHGLLIMSKVKLPNSAKRLLLENAVHSIDDLRKIKTEDYQYITINHNGLNYDDQYALLLISATTNYDLRFTRNKSSFTKSRSINIAKTQIEQDDEQNNFDIDSSVGQIEAYSNARRTGKFISRNTGIQKELMLPKEKHQKLSEHEKQQMKGITCRNVHIIVY